jgi:hypothetical protein
MGGSSFLLMHFPMQLLFKTICIGLDVLGTQTKKLITLSIFPLICIQRIFVKKWLSLANFHFLLNNEISTSCNE